MTKKISEVTNTQLLQHLAKLAEKIKTDEGIKLSASDFLKSYKGPVTPEFKAFISNFFILVAKYEVLKVKAEAFDKIHEHDKKLQENLKELGEDLDSFMKGEPIPFLPD